MEIMSKSYLDLKRTSTRNLAFHPEGAPMKRWLLTILLLLPPVRALAAGEDFACEMRALSGAERTLHGSLSRRLLTAVREKRELPDGYALQLPAGMWLPAARWADLERRCCPFFAFELASATRGGPLWLRITGPPGAKAFMRDELGF
jgi:hypothetical protein